MTDDLDLKLTTAEIYARGERRLKRRDLTSSDGLVFSSLRRALADVIEENYRLRRIIEAQDFLLNRSKPKNEVCQCGESQSSSR